MNITYSHSLFPIVVPITHSNDTIPIWGKLTNIPLVHYSSNDAYNNSSNVGKTMSQTTHDWEWQPYHL